MVEFPIRAARHFLSSRERIDHGLQNHAQLVDEKILKETTLTGTPEELVKRVKAMRQIG
jgi:hypothetical protein